MTDVAHVLGLAARLVHFAKHLPRCNALAGRFACGAVNGRNGRCPNRATIVFTGRAISRGRALDVVYRRCSEHPMSYKGVPLPAPAECSCGLVALIDEVNAETAR